ncbi:hypothetical protein OJAV_G00060440 [Oryzias javanicus]|uniref:Heat shock factor binding protein 1 n=1 Tax=Oryzias javanicus TaxID=123683 RepID=A0A437DBP0_ORYJA|nr:hypothetical protein OJAV_G00060440 [Oryzias javanicus]
MAETDPKSVQDLTNVVQTLLQQMQDKFQTMREWRRPRPRQTSRRRARGHPEGSYMMRLPEPFLLLEPVLNNKPRC